jgi:hypothetical protein
VDLRFFLPRPNRANNPSKPALRQQQKQIRRSKMMAAMTPMTIPAIAPGLRPWEVEWPVIGNVLPLAVAAGMKGTVVDAETVDVVIPPLVGRSGAEKVLVIVGFGMLV